MENKKLIKILLKDMVELEELISEIKSKGNFDFLEIEFLHTRAKGILQLMQMLKDFEPEMQLASKIREVEGNIVKNSTISNVNTEKRNNNISEKPLERFVEEPDQNLEEFIEQEQEEEIERSKIEIKEKSEVLEVVITKKQQVSQAEEKIEVEVKSIEDSEGSNVELEEETIEPGQRLGDSFLKGKSINDLVEEHNNLEHKLSNRPVSSIQTAIGINDRFQYIRELFDGSSDKFSEAVTSLDTMNNINEAVIYLQQNFKWKKNEISLKFVNLVKRRFANE